MNSFLYQVITLLLVIIETINGDRVEILVPKGSIAGEKYSLNDGHSVTRFLGIPYAKPPLGKLRYRRPVLIEKWNQTIEALHWPNSCYQKPEFLHRYNNKNFVEDCLYLNIWSPDVNVNEQNLKPVLIWIHGGAFTKGGTSDSLFDLERLAVMADAIMVSINYRLSGLGFFYSDQVDEIKGNQGLWDQVMALKWVNENIRYFGGNPNAITLMGNSAGSWAVSLHILSPVSRNLFNNAMMLSGAANYYAVRKAEDIVPKTLNVIRSIGCATEDDTVINESIVECMEQADVEKVENLSSIRSLVVVDNEFLPDDPISMIKSGNHKKNFNLLVSTVEDEGSFIFARTNDSFGKEELSLNDAKSILIKNIEFVNQDDKSYDTDAMLKTYFGRFNEFYDDTDLFKKQVGIAFGDLIIACPTLNFAKQLYKSDPSTINVYQWFYKAKLGRVKDLCSKWGGTCHTDELYPMFGKPFEQRQYFHNREREISAEIIDFIKSFIRTGKPGQSHMEWQKYFMTNTGINDDIKMVITPYYEIANNYRTYESFKFNLKQTECEIVWNALYQ
ncbi:acetylcholinesterase-like protein [Dermatophagoides farinae]|uniref:Carboxylic ester hydrolase n=1 Tax=Dermatophagoides farinae TaxID=6954 RepID=A0A9D4P7T6_DERFA|nr:acetylcholinesterase-like protein [Dermatophagoides farinae]